jgi:phosphatidylglycerophosphate synthase
MKYSPKFFKDGMPEWKRKKDAILSKIFYRPISFVIASFLASAGVSANTVSYVSALIGFIACLCFLPPLHVIHIVGAALINVWLILDCVDGNIARCVKQQPFGKFADSTSSYILVGLMCSMMSVSVYFEGGIFVPVGTPWIIFIGALASSSDSLMRLIYQKYKNVEREMADNGILQVENDIRTDNNKVGSLRVRIEAELGIAGILPFAILIASIFKALDIVIFYCFLYYGLSFIVVTLLYITKAIKRTKQIK